MRYKLVVMGSPSVGKSSLTVQLVKDFFVKESNTTMEEKYRTQMVVDGEACKLDILDTTGIEEDLPRRKKFMRWGEGFLCVYSVDDVRSFVDVNVLYNQLHRVKDTDHVPFVLVANKTDLTDCPLDPGFGQRAAQKFKVPFVQTSAKTGEGVLQAFEMLVREIRQAQVKVGQGLPDPQPVQGCGFRQCTIQ